MFREDDLQFLCDSLGVDSSFIKRKRMLTLVFTSVIAVISYFYGKNLMVVISIALIGLLVVKYEYWNLKNRFKQNASLSQLSFISFFGYILVFLEINFNLYQALVSSLSYISDLVKTDVEILIKQVDDDKTVTPYINFAKKFNSQLVEQICLLLYQFEQNGYDAELLNKFSPLMEKLRAQTMDEYIQNQSSSLDIFGLFPLVSTVVVTIALVLGILQSLVVMISG